MRILVTGAAGFIGQNLIQHLEKDHTVEGFEYTPNVYPDASRYDWVIHLGAISSTTETNVDKILTQNYEYRQSLPLILRLLRFSFALFGYQLLFLV